ncbi:MAG: SCO family protein [Gammaproteobacteria bacterium]
MSIMQIDKTPYKTIAAVAGIAAIAFFAGIFLAGINRKADNVPDVAGLLWPEPPTVQEFTLTNQHGEEFLETDFLGHWSFVFFGFTQCPDVCPTTLQTLKQTQELLASDETYAENGQVVFVSVDPERDTPELIKNYLAYFDEDFIGITGPEDKLKQLTQPLGILFMKIPTENSYTMDHSASIMLVDPEGRVLGLFSMPHDARKIGESFKEISQFYARQKS